MNIELNIVYGIIAILLWSTTVALIRSITLKINAIQAGVFTFALGGIVCVLYVLLYKSFDSITNQPPQYLLICGFLFVIYAVALFVAIDRAQNTQQAMELGLINYLWPILTVVLSLVILKQSVTVFLVPGIIISVFGIFIVVTQNSSFNVKSFFQNIKKNIVAYSSALIAAIVWAIYSNLVHLLGNAKAESAVFIFIPITGLFFILITLVSGKYRQLYKSLGTRTIIEIIVLSVTTVFAYILWDVSMRNTNVTSVAIFSYFTPFLSTLVVGIYLKEKIKRKLWFGCFLIVFGSLMSWYSIYK
jgi:drug/metabolite transporter (DMT)-like permease